jgi:hypothetical protein
MRVPSPLIDDLSRRPAPPPRAHGTLRYRRSGWLWLGYIVFGIALWIGAGFGIHALVNVL